MPLEKNTSMFLKPKWKPKKSRNYNKQNKKKKDNLGL